MKDDETVRRYHAAKNKEGAALPGVPNRDLTKGEFASYPKWLRESVDASGFWSEPAPVKPEPKLIMTADKPAAPAKDGA